MFCRHKQVFLATKHAFCRDKSMLVVTKVLSRKKTFVTLNICLDKHHFVVYFCHDKSMLVETKLLSPRDKHNLVATGILLSQQTRVCRDKTRQKYACRDKTFVAINTCLSQQYFFCRDKHMFMFVATKTILMAAPASDKRCPLSRTVWIRETKQLIFIPSSCVGNTGITDL